MLADTDHQATSRLAAQARGRDLDLEVAHQPIKQWSSAAAWWQLDVGLDAMWGKPR